MKNFMLRTVALLGAVVLCCGFLSACSDSDPEEQQPAPVSGLAVNLTKGAAGYYELNFTVTTKGAAACSYAWAKADETLPAADEILASGTAVATLNGASAEKITGLMENTTYRIVAAVKGADGSTKLSEPLEMKTTDSGTGSLDDMKLNYLSYAEYTFDSNTLVGNYTVTIGNARPNSSGDPAKDGDVMIVLDLYGEMAADQSDIHLPAGDYTVSGEVGVKGTWSNVHTAFYMRENGEASPAPMLDGVVSVEEDADGYKITAVMVLLDGRGIKATYEGPISFVFGGSSNFGVFTQPVDVTFEHYSEYSTRYYGCWWMPHADDLNITFYTGDVSGEDFQTDGYMLKLAPYMHKLADYNQDPAPIEEGVYTISAGKSNVSTAIPMTLDPGQVVTIWETDYPIDTYLTYVDGATGIRTQGMLTEGTMTVTKTGAATYRFEFDFKTAEGVPVTGRYEGSFGLKNYNDNDTSPTFPMPERPLSTLTKDVDLSFASGTTCVAFYMGNYLYPDYDSWMIWFNYNPSTQAPIAGHYMTTEILVPKGLGAAAIPAGTYALGWNPGGYVAFPGFLLHDGSTLYSWFADFARVDSEGVPYDMAPIDSGTFTVSKSGDNYKVVVDAADDGGHAIRGEWNGPILVVDITESASAAQMPKCKLQR